MKHFSFLLATCSCGSCFDGIEKQNRIVLVRKQRDCRQVRVKAILARLNLHVSWGIRLENKNRHFLLVSFKRFLVKLPSQSFYLIFHLGDRLSKNIYIQCCLAESLEQRCLQRSIPPLHLAICFSLDVSLSSINSGHPSLVCES